MRILVTNDDGITSVGLHVLAQRLSEVGQVTVFAPSREYSGAGTAIGNIGQGVPPVFVATAPPFDPSSANDFEAAYHFDGAPALAALLACRGLLGEPPDLVVAGINPGWNVGLAVHHSGTIGATVAAHSLGVASMAVSQPTWPRENGQMWDTAAAVSVGLVDRALADGRPLNVNVPNLAYDRLAGTKWTVPAQRVPWGLHQPVMVESPPGSGRFEVEYQHDERFDSFEGSDTSAVMNGFVSVTPIVTSYAATVSDSSLRMQ